MALIASGLVIRVLLFFMLRIVFLVKVVCLFYVAVSLFDEL